MSGNIDLKLGNYFVTRKFTDITFEIPGKGSPSRNKIIIRDILG